MNGTPWASWGCSSGAGGPGAAVPPWAEPGCKPGAPGRCGAACAMAGQGRPPGTSGPRPPGPSASRLALPPGHRALHACSRLRSWVPGKRRELQLPFFSESDCQGMLGSLEALRLPWQQGREPAPVAAHPRHNGLGCGDRACSGQVQPGPASRSATPGPKLTPRLNLNGLSGPRALLLARHVGQAQLMCAK